jgi:fructose-1,6-bisphosphatase/inositol monophosphatase family enzyme
LLLDFQEEFASADGTKEFVSGIPEYAVSVALVESGLPILAAVYNPAAEELFAAARGQVAWLNGNAIKAEHAISTKRFYWPAVQKYNEGSLNLLSPSRRYVRAVPSHTSWLWLPPVWQMLLSVSAPRMNGT